MLEVGDVIEGFEPNELVEIESIKEIGSLLLISGVTFHTKRRLQKPVSPVDCAKFKKVRGSGYSFDGDPALFLLGSEAERISIAYHYDPMFAVNSSVVDELPHQVEAVYKYLLPLPRIRFLLADDTGGGKTIMAGLLLKEMFFRGTIQRALIITPGGLTKQWQEDELQEKFGLQFKLIDRAVFKSNPNEFAASDRCIASIDFIRQEDVLNSLESVPAWDIVIVDEAHKLSAYEYGSKIDKGQRYKAIETLSKRTDHLLFLTATPHRGRKDTFRRLMMLLDEDLFSKDEHIKERVIHPTEVFEFEGKIEEANNRFFLRRLKEDMTDWQGEALYVERFTQTPGYDLTPEELRLYNAVTQYVHRLRKAAKEQKNRNVELMLMVMQRRLASSIFAITRTLINRQNRLEFVLQILLDPRFSKQKEELLKQESQNPLSYDAYFELADDQREDLDDRIYRYVLSSEPEDIRKEIIEVKQLVELAESLQGHKEQKFIELTNVLDQTDILRRDDGKLLIFTEHRDTMNNLKERLEQKGLRVSVIHGKMDVDERKKAQREFRTKSQIMIATDAAGEGINLQFCNFLINWDIPWNPNRLEQRMGRIHRYGQKNKVHVYNLVAQNTREGNVLKRVLDKLEIMREQLGTDRVFDVIDELFEDVPLTDLILKTENYVNNERDINEHIQKMDNERAQELINLQRKQSLVSKLDLGFSRSLRNKSEERRLQPLFIERFFKKTFAFAGGTIKADEQYPIFHLGKIPASLLQFAREKRKQVTEYYHCPFVFDKRLVSIASPVKVPEETKLLGPGHPLFETLLEYVQKLAKDAFARGTALIDPKLTSEQKAWLVRSTVKDARPDETMRLANQRLDVIIQDHLGFRSTSASYFIDCCPSDNSSQFLSDATTPANEEIAMWTYEHITAAQLKDVEQLRKRECAIREEYLTSAFTELITERMAEMNDLDEAALHGENVGKEREVLQAHIARLQERRSTRLAELNKMLALSAELPDILTCARILPTGAADVEVAVEDSSSTDMHRDEEVEAMAMKIAMDYERKFGATVYDVSKENLGYDVRSERSNGEIRYIEVKGRAGSGGVILTENELRRLEQLAESAWLYIVTNCNTGAPVLRMINNPMSVLEVKELFRQVQYFVTEAELMKTSVGTEKTGMETDVP